MREIPSLRILALRAVGPAGCNPEITFGGPPRDQRSNGVDSSGSNDENDNNGDTANAISKQKSSSLKIRMKRSASGISSSSIGDNNKDTDNHSSLPPKEPTMTSRLLRSLRDSTLPQQPYSGPGRPNANDVDIAHPWIMAVYPPREPPSNAPLMITTTATTTEDENENDTNHETTTTTTTEFLTIEHSNRAVECIQQFIDALVESGRAGDSRMGVHFFREWVSAAIGHDAANAAITAKKDGKEKRSSSKKRQKKKRIMTNESLPLGSLSLHNFAAGSTLTFGAMEKANVGCCLGTLDVSGVHGLTDDILADVICNGSFPRLRRLSVKNCRKLTGKGIAALSKLNKLTALDLGGCFNIHPNDVISLVQSHPSTKKGRLTELYASGLGWTDVALEEIVDLTEGHLRGLGVGFSPYISGPGLSLILSRLASTLDRLAVPFCPGMDDAAAAALGSKLPNLAVLDIRGCNKVYSLSGIMDQRSEGATAGHLFVLARYSGISNNSLEETMRLYDGLSCILDGGGVGEGIRR